MEEPIQLVASKHLLFLLEWRTTAWAQNMQSRNRMSSSTKLQKWIPLMWILRKRHTYAFLFYAIIDFKAKPEHGYGFCSTVRLHATECSGGWDYSFSPFGFIQELMWTRHTSEYRSGYQTILEGPPNQLPMMIRSIAEGATAVLTLYFVRNHLVPRGDVKRAPPKNESTFIPTSFCYICDARQQGRGSKDSPEVRRLAGIIVRRRSLGPWTFRIW